jgi:uncharacterized protein
MDWSALNWGTFFSLFGLTFVAGAFGGLLGVGGGVIMVPMLTLIFHVPIQMAVGTSLISVIGTSTAAALVYTGESYTDVRLALLLELATTAGALAGGSAAAYLSPHLLQFLFAVVMAYTALSMGRGHTPHDAEIPLVEGALPGSREERGFKLAGEYFDAAQGARVRYRARRIPVGMAASCVAGSISGLLGIGGGIIKVPVMHVLMGVPLKVAVATSNFMIGITAATSALVYYRQELINPLITAPAVLGILLGAQVGARLGRRVRSERLKRIFIVMLLFIAVQMLLKALRGGD